ncbi:MULTISPECIES: GntR family transcriptional regulator [Streptomyces]|uniref:GntR family transcriptional regulator n=1 Tax=Streptomyces TaxID=1883 RepID=UPI001EE6483D|nr:MULTISPECIES: GntR family transcriptional regulator [Streptomyces]
MENLAIKREDCLGERVAHELRVQVISGRLRSGTHLVEGQLAERFDVSRGPVRDALRRLEAEVWSPPSGAGCTSPAWAPRMSKSSTPCATPWRAWP